MRLHPETFVAPASRRCDFKALVYVLSRNVVTFLPILLAITATFGAESSPAESSTNPVDEAAFRAGLRERGLDTWLEFYLEEVPPVDEVDALLRDREALMAEAEALAPGDPARVERIERASAILAQLLESRGRHPARLQWHFERARDLIERTDPAAFEAVLIYELPGRDRLRVQDLSGKAITVLTALRQELDDAWRRVEEMDEAAIEAATESGALDELELMDARAALMLSWARFYHALSREPSDPSRREETAEVLSEVTQHFGWTARDRPAEQRCAGLIMAAVLAREIDRFDDADTHARAIISLYRNLPDASVRQRLEKASLLAVLEQIRIVRDRGEFEGALAAMEQGRQWAERSRPDDVTAALALALAHRHVLARQIQAAGAEPGGPGAGGPSASSQRDGLLRPSEALEPIERFAARSPEIRESLYATISGALVEEPATLQTTPFQLQLLLGAAVADCLRASDAKRDAAIDRLEQIRALARQRLQRTDPPVPYTCHGEILYLLGRAQQLLDRPLEAVQALDDLVERFDRHDRCDRAASLAVLIAQDMLRQDRYRDSRGARDAFVTAVRRLRARSPDSPVVRRLQYFVAAALEANRQWEDAAAEYARVPDDDPRSLEAALARVRCLRDAVHQAVAQRSLAEADIARLAEQALEASDRTARTLAERTKGSTDPGQQSLVAEILLCRASLLNRPPIERPADALAALDGFENRFADLPELVGPALREKVLALRQLKRLTEAREVVNDFLRADPDGAGPAMAQLLGAMREEILAAANRGDAGASRDLAREAAGLARQLIEWAQEYPDRMSAAEKLTIRIWLAWSARRAGEPASALSEYKACHRANNADLRNHDAFAMEIDLGRAECMLDLEQAADALPLFTKVMQQCPEHSPTWWRAYVGSLQCHSSVGSEPAEIVQSIRQQRQIDPDLGGGQFKRQLETLEQQNLQRAEAAP